MNKIDRQAVEARLQQSYSLQGRWHNGFHLEMPFGLINDPNGLSYVNGEYHIFYQWNPLGCQHKNKCWAHVRTRDFVNYSVPELAMWPTDVHDKDGCYSGCGFVEDEQLRIFYTCNSKDEAGHRTPAQRLGTLQADGTIAKEEIVLSEEAEGYTPHFRDPYIFSKNGEKYFVVGAQTEDLKGRAVVYRQLKPSGQEADAADGQTIPEEKTAGSLPSQLSVHHGSGQWQLLGEIQTRYKNFGYMWECPNFLTFDKEDALLFCPQGLEPQEYAYQNLYQSGYVTGQWHPDTMVMEHGDFQELDRGFDFYAPQVLVQEDRKLLLGWMGMPEHEAYYPTAEEGWLFSLTVPRELSLKQGHIYQQPARELENLRVDGYIRHLCAIHVDSYEIDLPYRCDLSFACLLGQAKTLGFVLEYGEEVLQFIYNREEQLMTIDRNGMKLGARGVRRFHLPVEEMLQVRMLIDTSAIEVFFQQGREAASILIFPEKATAPVFRLASRGKIKALEGNCWGLRNYKFER